MAAIWFFMKKNKWLATKPPSSVLLIPSPENQGCSIILYQQNACQSGCIYVHMYVNTCTCACKVGESWVSQGRSKGLNLTFKVKIVPVNCSHFLIGEKVQRINLGLGLNLLPVVRNCGHLKNEKKGSAAS